MSLQPNSHHPVDFHANLSFFSTEAMRLEVEHREITHPRVASERARIVVVRLVSGAYDDQIIELDERTTVSFCQALLAGFDHPDMPEHRSVELVATLVSALQTLNYTGDVVDLANALSSTLKQWGLEINRTGSTS